MNKGYLINLEKVLKTNDVSLYKYCHAVALIESALHLGADLDNWIMNESKNFPSLPHGEKILKLATFDLAKKHLDKWPLALRQSVSRCCKESNYQLADKYSVLRLAGSPSGELKKIGAIYTPAWLADYVTSLSYQYWGQLHRTGKKPASIADMSCGTGVFLSSARKFYGHEARLVGQDVDQVSIDYASLFSLCEGINAELNTADTLLSSECPLSNDLNAKFDIIIGNPPYVRVANLNQDYAQKIQHKYSDVVSGNFDLVVPFIKQSSDLLHPGGIVSYIVSSKFMHSKYGRQICKFLANDVRLINIVDFNDAQLFEGYTTYTSILTFAKLKPVEKLSVTHFPEQIVGSDSIKKSKKFTLLRSSLNVFPWNLSTTENQAILKKIFNDKNPYITDIFSNILQGVRTGINEVFILDKDICVNRKFEKNHTRPYVNGECIRRGRMDDEKYRILYPYHKTDQGIKLLDEGELFERSPNIYKYLLEKKPRIIESRDLIDGKWYGYSRPQNLGLPYRKKIFVKEMMPRAEFAADIRGDVIITSGYAIIADNLNSNEILLWTWILNTPVMEFVLRQSGTQLHSSWFRLMKGHLDRVRLPLLQPVQKNSAFKLIKTFNNDPEKLIEKLNKIVVEAFSLTNEEVAYIETFLDSLHAKSMNKKDIPERQSKKLQNKDLYYPVKLEKYEKYHTQNYTLRQLVTFQKNKSVPIHKWYSFTQGFSDGLIEHLIEKMAIKPGDLVMDPFAGSGTTLLSCTTRGIGSLGIEISPFLAWISEVKLTSLRLSKPERLINEVDDMKSKELGKSTKRSLIFDDYLSKAFSQKILFQIINLNEKISSLNISKQNQNVLQLALISILEDISQIRKHGSHYRFMLNENSIGLQKLNTKIINPDAEILPIYKKKVGEMVKDIVEVQKQINKKTLPKAQIINTDIRTLSPLEYMPTHVITSPPYLNRNNYIAQQKTELVLLSFIKSKEEYKKLVKMTFRSHTDSDLNVDDLDEVDPEIKKIISNISLSENNNPKIPEMVAGYFLDLRKTLEQLHRQLPKGAKLAFVVGNSRWGGVVVPVDHLLMNMAEKMGFRAKDIVVTRLKGNSPQQMRKYGKISVRESVVIFEKL